MKTFHGLLVLLATAVCTGAAPRALPGAQGGRRGPPEAVRQRLGAYFTEAALPDANNAQERKTRLARCQHVARAAEKGVPSVLYLFDPKGDERKHKQFESVMYGNEALCVALKGFAAARFDISKDAGTRADYERMTPLFAVFDQHGKPAGEISMRGYRANPNQLIKVLERASAGHGDLPLDRFIKDYRGFLNDLTVLYGRKKTLENQRGRAMKKHGRAREVKLAELAADAKELEAEEHELMDTEKELLQRAKIPERDPEAQRVGGRERGRGR